MTESLFPFYQDELFFIRKMAHEFARQYPAAAARLQLEANRSSDPHVERLIEAFALMTGRIQHKLHDDFPELTEAILNVLYPHYLAPMPSFATVEFELDPDRAIPTGVKIDRGMPVHTPPIRDTECKYRTCYPLTLWPFEVSEAKLQPPPFPPGLQPPDNARACLRLRLTVQGELPLKMLEVSSLQFHVAAGLGLSPPLYELILNHALQVVYRRPDSKETPPIVMSANQAIAPVGFDPEHGLLPYPRQSFPAYRLLSEFFAYPAKYLYFDLNGIDRVRQAGFQKQIEVFIFLDRSLARLEQAVDKSVFKLGCTPVVNLFEQTTEPIPMTHLRTEHRVVADVARPHGIEVYSVESVLAANPDGSNREYRPFYDFRHGNSREVNQPFWYTSRRPALGEGMTGTDVYVRLVDRQFDPRRPADETLIIRTICTNRDLPERLPRDGDEVRFTNAFAAPIRRVRCPRSPTIPSRPPYRRGTQWRLISHLNLNHLSLTSDGEGRLALQELLRLYDPTDPSTQEQLAALARKAIEGITDLKSRPAVALINGGVARGTEMTIEFDEAEYVETSAFLFGAVLDRFFAQYASLNSFTQTVVKLKGRPGELKRWPPRAGARPLI